LSRKPRGGGEGEGGEHGGGGDGEGDDRGDGGEEDGDEQDAGVHDEFGLLVRINVDGLITRRVGGKLQRGLAFFDGDVGSGGRRWAGKKNPRRGRRGRTGS
jgi:hypothetical protein